MKKKVVVGLSGGVDSSVAAALLKENGFEVIGVFMKIWAGEKGIKKGGCYGPEENDLKSAEITAKILNIPLIVVDVVNEFKKIVLSYFKKEYFSGRTPNPCIICNRFIKFGILIEKIKEMGVDFDYFATGHYAIVEYNKERGRYVLKKSVDEEKDQSYFLSLLTQKQLSKLIFPLGHLKKNEVREIGKKYGLPSSEKEESQDFISGDKFFIFGQQKQGDIFDTEGNYLGKHKGIHFYTIGQRRGMGVAKGYPVYVVEIDGKKNRIIVGKKKDVYKKCLIAGKVNPVSVDRIENGMKVEGKIRYKSSLSEATVFPVGKDKIIVKFEKPQWAITPGQAVVLYKGDEVICGAIIEKGVKNEEIDMYIQKGKEKIFRSS